MTKNVLVDEYINSLNKDSQNRVTILRNWIKEEYPNIEEYPAYGVIGYKFKKAKLYLGGFKNHVSIFPGPDTIDKFTTRLQDYSKSKGTIKFPNAKQFPLELIKEIIIFVFS